MKRHLWIPLGVLAATVLLVYGCKKKTASPKEVSIQSFFTVEGAIYHGGQMPGASGSSENQPQILDIQGNSAVVPGGTQILNISASDPQNDILYVLLGIQSFSGYYVLDWSEEGDMTLTLLMESELPQDSFVIVVALQDEGGHVSSWAQLIVRVVSVTQGQLQITLTWDQFNDLDLHVVQPDSEEIYYGHPVSSEGGFLDIDSNAACDIDSVNNEHVTYPDTAVVLSGQYIVRADMWSNCEVPVPTHYSVSARLNGALIPVTSGQNPYTGVFQPQDEDHGGEGSGLEVMRFQIQSTDQVLLWEYPQAEANLSESARWKLQQSH